MPKPPVDIKAVDFKWARCSDLYEIFGNKVLYKAGGGRQYRPVVGDLSMAPNTGKYFYEIYVNCDNTLVGLCTADVDLDGELGKTPENVSLNLQTGIVEANGIEVKQLWRIVTPVSGARLGFVHNSDTGVTQLYFDCDYAGVCFGPECCLVGKTLYPCVGLAGIELNNRDIGVGKKTAVITQDPEFYYNMVY